MTKIIYGTSVKAVTSIIALAAAGLILHYCLPCLLVKFAEDCCVPLFHDQNGNEECRKSDESNDTNSPAES